MFSGISVMRQINKPERLYDNNRVSKLPARLFLELFESPTLSISNFRVKNVRVLPIMLLVNKFVWTIKFPNLPLRRLILWAVRNIC